MPDIKYLCIDDQQDRTVGDLLDGVSNGRSIAFERRTPVEVGLQIQQIISEATANRNAFGLLLDLRLDTEADSNGDKVPYRGPTLAQELRTRMAEGEIVPAFPIVLWTIDENFLKSFCKDETSHDLFDAVYVKDGLITQQQKVVAKEMISLAVGYRVLNESKQKKLSADKILGLETDDNVGVYAGFIDELADVLDNRPDHQVVQLLLKQLIQVPGLLVNEALVAARLGIDVKASHNAWECLKSELSKAYYRGPFCDGWERWWWFRVEDWWATLSEKQPNLRRISAQGRVQLLNDKFCLDLVAAPPIRETYSSKYYTLCVATKLPLDPVDGLRIVQRDRKSWHDTQYVSVDAALNRIHKETWRIDPMDRERFDRFKEGSEV
jgi:hypothetical protein